MQGMARTDRSADAGKARRHAFVWDDAHRMQRLQVFGAGGAVGRELAGALLRTGHPVSRLALFARQVRRLTWKGSEIPVQPMRGMLPPAELAFLCTPPELARRLAPALVQRGVRVIDLSGGHRWRSDVPMVEPGINLSGVGAFTQLVALPGRTSALVALPLWALERAAGLAEVVCTVLRSSAGEGARGILELRRQMRAGVEGLSGNGSLGMGALGAGGAPSLAGNLIPAAGEELVEGQCAAESELVWDLRQLFASPELPVDVSAVQVGVERCDGFALSVILKRPLSPAGAAQAMAAVPGIRVVGAPCGPTPLDALGSDEVHVGRIRTGSRGPCSLSLFAVGDQLRLGAVSSALAVAARLPACG